MIWIYTIILLALGLFLMFVAVNTFTEGHNFCGSLTTIFGIIALILALLFAITSVIWTFEVINLEVEKLNVIEKRTMYVQLLENYNEDLMPKDYTASDSYYKLYKNIHKFNSTVRKAEKWGKCWWLSGVLYSPVYVGMEPIHIE